MDIIWRYDSNKIRQCNLDYLVLLLLEIVEMITELESLQTQFHANWVVTDE